MEPRIECLQCGYTGSVDQFPINNEEWTCPRCQMDESGINVRWAPEDRAEVRTHPDVNELVDAIAEKFRVLLWDGDDDLEDKLEDMVATLFPKIFEDAMQSENFGSNDDPHFKLLLAAQDEIMYQVRHMLLPKIIRVVKRGDWRKHSDG